MNYVDNNWTRYDALRETHPDWIIYGAENSSATKSRGIYAHPDSEEQGMRAAIWTISSPLMTTIMWAGAAPRHKVW